MPAPSIDPLPTAPTSDLPRETFDLTASAWVNALAGTFTPQVNAFVDWANSGDFETAPSGFVATDIATTTIASTVKAVPTAGYTTAGSGGAVYVADEYADAALAAAHPIFCKADSVGAYRRLSLENGLNILAAGAVADDTIDGSGTPTNNGATVIAAFAYMRAMIQAGAPVSRRIHAPSGRYYLGTSTVEVKFTCIIEGDPGELGTDVGGGEGTRFRWTGTSTTGFRFQGYDTYSVDGQHGVGGAPANDGLWSQNSILRNIKLHGGWAGVTEGEGHGVHLRGTTICENVTVREWPGDGFYADANTSLGGTYGNVNGSQFTNCKTVYCRNGFYFNGADVNGLTFDGCWNFLNRRYGRWHTKGIGNVITGELAESNGRSSVFPVTCHYGGSWYYCLPTQETGAATNHPKGAVVTITIASPGVVSYTAHGLANGDVVGLDTTGALPTGLAIETTYYVVNKTTDTFQLAATSGGAAINTSGSQSGVHTLGVGAANTWWGHLDVGNGGVDVPDWSNGMSIRSGGMARFDGAGQDGVYSSYREDNQAPAQMQAQYIAQGISTESVDFTGTPWSGQQYVEGDAMTFGRNVLIKNNGSITGTLTVGSTTKTSNTEVFLKTNTGNDCIIYGNFGATSKAPYYSMQANGDLTLASDGAIGYLYRNGTGYIAKWTSAGFFVPLSGGKLGYDTGAGGAVTQATSRTTGVTLNKGCGQITLVSAAGSTTPASFTVTNSVVEAGDVVQVSQKSGTDKYELDVTAVGAGSFEITFNTKSGTTTEQPVFSFAVLKAVAA